MNARRFALAALLVLALVCPATAIEDHYFDSNGVKIHYIVEGEGTPLVLVHGFTANIQAQWGAPGLISKLSKDYKVVALDNRGHGKSDKPHDPTMYGPEMINDVVRLMDHLGISKAHVVGYSMGGFMTNYLRSTFPDRLLSATLGGAGWARSTDERMVGMMDQLADSLEKGNGITPLIEHLTPPGQPKPSEEQLKGMNQMLMLVNDPKALAACIRGMRGLGLTEAQLKANRVQTLALIGDQDPLKQGVDEMQKVMSNLKVEVLPGANHMTTFTQPKFYNDLKVFLEANSSKPVAAAAAAAGN